MLVQSFVSIIVPIYNAEKYLRQCLDSVLSQSFSDWECILVDDGSSDGSAQICDEFADKDARFFVFHKENAGVGSARNFGIEKASGKYLIFLDSDDFLENNCLENLLSRKFIPDLTIFAFSKVLSGNVVGIKKLKSTFSDNPARVKEILLDMKADSYTSDAFCFPWDKLFRLTLIRENDIKFPLDIHLREDEIFMYRYLNVCKSLEILSEPLHFYRITRSGLTYRKRPYEEDLKLAEYILTETKLMQTSKEFANSQVIRALLYHFSALMNVENKSGKKRILKKMKVIYSSNKPKAKKNDRIIAKLVLKFLCLPDLICFKLFQLLGFAWQRKSNSLINV